MIALDHVLKKKLGDTEYTVIPIPPSLSPYNTLVGELLNAKPKSFDEAERNSIELGKLVDKVLSGTVTPKPKTEHETALYNILTELTNAVLNEAEFFRKNQRPTTDKGNQSGAGAASKAK